MSNSAEPECGRYHVVVDTKILNAFFTEGDHIFSVEEGLPQSARLYKFVAIHDPYIHLFFIPPENESLSSDVTVYPIIKETNSRPMTVLRQISALIGDYLAHDFPASSEEMCVEFTEVAEEIKHLVDPIVEDADE